MLKEDEVRKKVKALRTFYQEGINFLAVNLIFVFIWLTFDRTEVFWPKYMIALWAVVLMWRAYRLGIVPLLFHRPSFLSQEWEEKKVREMMQRRNFSSKTPSDEDRKNEE